MNLDMGQVTTIVSSLPAGAPVIVTAGSLLALIQAAGSTPIPYYPTQDGGPAPADLTQFAGV